MANTFSTATAPPVRDTSTRPVNGITPGKARRITARAVWRREIPSTLQVVSQLSLNAPLRASEYSRPRYPPAGIPSASEGSTA
ncbi:hypothetical protein D3C80_1504890 [compost metagenome]